MIVDFHTHIFPDKIAEKTVNYLAAKINVTPQYLGHKDGLMEMLNRAGADLAVALPVVTNPKQFDSINAFASELNEQTRGACPRILSFAGIHPACEDIAGKMAFLKEKGFLGVKIHPDYQETFIDDEGYVEILKCANEYDLIVVTHSGVDDGYPDCPVRCTPDRLLNLFEKVQPKKLVLAHLGANRMWQEVYEKICGLNVYLDTAFTLNFIDEALFKRIVEKHGADKILFGTDAPWQDLKNNLEKLYSFRLEQDVLEKILYKNALKLLNT